MKEYKIIEVNKEKSFEHAENLMKEMSAEGWEVVNVAVDAWSKVRVQFLITFEREIN